jgi:opacity protein-like surface antigen
MKMQTKTLLLAIVALTLSASVSAIAPGFYLGGDFGQSNLHNTSQTIETGGTPPTISSKADNTGIGIRLFMGANFNSYAAFEMGLAHYASTSYGGVPTTIANNTPSIHEYGLDLEAKGIVPAGPVSIFGKLGFAYIRKSASGVLESCSAPTSNSGGVVPPCSTTSSVQNSTQANALRPLLGVGVSYDASQNWQAELSYTQVMKGSGIQNASLLAFGISYHVVDLYCGQFLC